MLILRIAGTKDLYYTALHEFGELPTFSVMVQQYACWHTALYSTVMYTCVVIFLTESCFDLTPLFSGHAIGLNHSSDYAAVMNPYNPASYVANLVLKQDDIDGCRVTHHHFATTLCFNYSFRFERVIVCGRTPSNQPSRMTLNTSLFTLNAFKGLKSKNRGGWLWTHYYLLWTHSKISNPKKLGRPRLSTPQSEKTVEFLGGDTMEYDRGIQFVRYKSIFVWMKTVNCIRGYHILDVQIYFFHAQLLTQTVQT